MMQRGRSASLSALDVPWMTPPPINVSYSLLNYYEPLPSPTELPLPAYFPLPPQTSSSLAASSSFMRMSSHTRSPRRLVRAHSHASRTGQARRMYVVASDDDDEVDESERRAQRTHKIDISPQIVHVAEMTRARRGTHSKPTRQAWTNTTKRETRQLAPQRAAPVHAPHSMPRTNMTARQASMPVGRRTLASVTGQHKPTRQRHSVSSTRSSSSSSSSSSGSPVVTDPTVVSMSKAHKVHDTSDAQAKVDVADRYLAQIEQLFARLRASYVGLQTRQAAQPTAAAPPKPREQAQRTAPQSGTTTNKAATNVGTASRPSPPVSSSSSMPPVSSIGPASRTRRSPATASVPSTTTTSTAERNAAQELRDELARLERQWRRLEEMRRSGSHTSSLPQSSLSAVPASTAVGAVPETEKVMALIRSRRAAIQAP